MKFGMYLIKNWLRVLGNLAWVCVIFRGRLVKSTPKFAYALIVDSRELADTERLQRGLHPGGILRGMAGLYLLLGPGQAQVDRVTPSRRDGVNLSHLSGCIMYSTTSGHQGISSPPSEGKKYHIRHSAVYMKSK